MQLSGHKTRQLFDRCGIESPHDVHDAEAKPEALMERSLGLQSRA